MKTLTFAAGAAAIAALALATTPAKADPNDDALRLAAGAVAEAIIVGSDQGRYYDYGRGYRNDYGRVYGHAGRRDYVQPRAYRGPPRWAPACSGSCSTGWRRCRNRSSGEPSPRSSKPGGCAYSGPSRWIRSWTA